MDLGFDFDASSFSLGNLEHIVPRFSVPPLLDKPQNPIHDTLKKTSISTKVTREWREQLEIVPEGSIHPPSDSLWSDAVKRDKRKLVRPISLSDVCLYMIFSRT
jgi:hypothetical protein